MPVRRATSALSEVLPVPGVPVMSTFGWVFGPIPLAAILGERRALSLALR